MSNIDINQDDASFISHILNACLNSGKLYKESIFKNIESYTINEIKDRIKVNVLNSKKYDFTYEELNAEGTKVLSYKVTEKKSDIVIHVFIYLKGYVELPDKRKTISNMHFDYIKREKASFSSDGIFRRKNLFKSKSIKVFMIRSELERENIEFQRKILEDEKINMGSAGIWNLYSILTSGNFVENNTRIPTPILYYSSRQFNQNIENASQITISQFLSQIQVKD